MLMNEGSTFMKKFLCLFIAVVISLSIMVPVSASEITYDDSYKTDIITELSYFENSKEMIGLGDVNFNNLFISEKIYIYEYLETGFNQISEAYLLFENNDIVSLAYKVDEHKYQFMSALTALIDNSGEDSFCIVYDKYSCYLYNGDSFVELSYNEEYAVDSRGVILSETQVSNANLNITDVSQSVSLNYTSSMSLMRVQTNYFCSISYVTQNPYDNICWAATTAMISNSVNGTSLTAVDVASDYYTDTDFDHGLNPSIVDDVMRSRYNLSYTYKNQVPSDGVILSNIVDGYPIYASFLRSDGNGGHAVALYGVNVIAGRIVIMNPLTGSNTCFLDSDGNYSYVSSISGKTFVFSRAICHSWEQ